MNKSDISLFLFGIGIVAILFLHFKQYIDCEKAGGEYMKGAFTYKCVKVIEVVK